MRHQVYNSPTVNKDFVNSYTIYLYLDEKWLKMVHHAMFWFFKYGFLFFDHTITHNIVTQWFLISCLILGEIIFGLRNLSHYLILRW